MTPNFQNNNVPGECELLSSQNIPQMDPIHGSLSRDDDSLLLTFLIQFSLAHLTPRSVSACHPGPPNWRLTILVCDWSALITWPGYWPVIGCWDSHVRCQPVITGSHRHHHQDLKYCGKYRITFRHYFTQTAKNVLSQGNNGGTTTLFFSVHLIVIASFVRSIDFFTEPSLYWDHLESLHHLTMAALTGWHGKL